MALLQRWGQKVIDGETNVPKDDPNILEQRTDSLEAGHNYGGRKGRGSEDRPLVPVDMRRQGSCSVE